jgi:hypothetical protein
VLVTCIVLLYFSRVFRCLLFLSVLMTCIVSVILLYACPVFCICLKYPELLLLFLMPRMCSLYLLLNDQPVCPMYFNGQLMHFT